jgi:hypothetical protein
MVASGRETRRTQAPCNHDHRALNARGRLLFHGGLAHASRLTPAKVPAEGLIRRRKSIQRCKFGEPQWSSAKLGSGTFSKDSKKKEHRTGPSRKYDVLFGLCAIAESEHAISCGFGCHRYHAGMLKPTLGGNYEYFHLQALGDSDFPEPRGACDFI